VVRGAAKAALAPTAQPARGMLPEILLCSMVVSAVGQNQMPAAIIVAAAADEPLLAPSVA
jgi:hypothetical protein